jgi:hypothetical protein
MQDSEEEGQSDDLLEYYECLVRVFTAFVKYDVWYPLASSLFTSTLILLFTSRAASADYDRVGS